MTESTESVALKPQIFGRYCLLERLSTGGMAEIFRARLFFPKDPTTYLVIKRILPHFADDAEFITMFVDEARITTQLSHPNICQLYELGRLDGGYYIVMEYIAGRDILSLINWYRRQRSFLPPSQVAYIVAEICAGLDYAHAKRDSRGNPLDVVHRDISPQNVLLGYDGSVKVIDFGIARVSGRRHRTEVGVLKGKFGYMSPEQVRGDDIDNRSDIFATGILLWEMLTARRLFYSKNEVEIIDRVRTMEIPPPSTVNRDIPPELDAIVARALERDRDLRYQRAGEMEEDLRKWLSGLRPPYSRRAMAAWMQRAYGDEIAEERDKDALFAEFMRPQDVVRYLEDTGQPLPKNLEGKSAQAMSGNELHRMDTEMTRGAGQILVASANDPVPTMLSANAPTRIKRPRRRKGSLTLAISVGVFVAIFALVFAFAKGTSLGTKGRLATVEISVSEETHAILYVDDMLYSPGVLADGKMSWRLEKLNPGHHTLRVIADGYQERIENVLVQAGQDLKVDLVLEEKLPDFLDITLEVPQNIPHLRMAIDGVEVSTEQVHVLTMQEEDVHQVDLAASGYLPVSERVQRDGKKRRHVFSLQPISTQLSVSTDEPSAVWVNGTKVDVADERVTLTDLAPFESHSIVVRPDAPGFQPFKIDFVFDGVFQRHLHVQPLRIGQRAPENPKVGTLRFIGDTFYLVEIDGRSAGFATGMEPQRIAVPAGPHEVTLRVGPHESVFSVDVRPGRVESIRVPVLSQD